MLWDVFVGLRREFEAEGVLSKVDGREFLRRIGIVGELGLDCWIGISVVGVESEKGESKESRDVGSNVQ
jgi:hypothetical protein